MKGFLLLLKCLGFKGSNTVLYSLDKIGKLNLLRIGLNKIKELNRLGISLQVISKVEKGYVITDRFIYEDLPAQKADSVSERILVDYYNEIAAYCKRMEIKPPKYDKDIMNTIFYNCPNLEQFIDKMNNRNFSKTQIYSLKYFVKSFNFKKPVKKKRVEPCEIIMF